MTTSFNYSIYDVVVSGLDKHECNTIDAFIKSDRKEKKNDLPRRLLDFWSIDFLNLTAYHEALIAACFQNESTVFFNSSILVLDLNVERHSRWRNFQVNQNCWEFIIKFKFVVYINIIFQIIWPTWKSTYRSAVLTNVGFFDFLGNLLSTQLESSLWLTSLSLRAIVHLFIYLFFHSNLAPKIERLETKRLNEHYV